MTSSPTPAVPTERWRFVDSLRGFALFGVLLVNAIDIVHVGITRALAGGAPVADPVRDALYLTVQTRFVPIFVFLFGMSLWFVLTGARARSGRPWLVMLRRLLTLAVIGGLLLVVYPGNILLEYGIVGLLVLPVVLFAPRWLSLSLGVAMTVVAYGLLGGGLAATPGLMLLGAAAAAYGIPSRLEKAGKAVVVVFLAAVTVSVPALLWQLTQPGDPRFTLAGGIAGLVMAIAYLTGLALLWRTPAQRVIAAIFEPLGRMALSNYTAAAIVFAGLAHVIDFAGMTSVLPVILVSCALIGLQSVLSRMWLDRFAYGPVEWVWRMATWARPVRLRAEVAR